MKRLAFALGLLILLAAAPARAQTGTQPVPGNSCTAAQANQFTLNTLYPSTGFANAMFCNPPTLQWLGVINFESSGNVGIGTTSPSAMLQVANRIIVGGSGADTFSVFVTGGNSTSTGTGNTAVGYSALSANTTGASNTAFGIAALQNNTTASYSTAIGYGTLSANAGNYNTALGRVALSSNTTGSNNTALGHGALVILTTGSSNVAVGDSVASTTLKTGSNNILIGTGSAVDTPAVGTSNFLDIGNVIFASAMTGTLAGPAGNVGIGTSTPAAPLHVNGEAIVGYTGLACSATTAGAIRFNSATGYPEFCNGTAWTAYATVQSTPPETAPAGSGYFVLTKTTYTGNLGGVAGGDSLCLTELTTNTGWAGYSTANSNGQLVAAKVHAFLGNGNTGGNNLMPLTTYYFANAGNASAGGSYFTTDSDGDGPNDNANWAAANYFSGSYSFWTNRSNGTSTAWWPGGDRYSTACSGWVDSSSGNTGDIGQSAYTDQSRWYSAYTSLACNTAQPIICFVNP